MLKGATVHTRYTHTRSTLIHTHIFDCRSQGRALIYVPIPCSAGTVVLCQPLYPLTPPPPAMAIKTSFDWASSGVSRLPLVAEVAERKCRFIVCFRLPIPLPLPAASASASAASAAAAAPHKSFSGRFMAMGTFPSLRCMLMRSLPKCQLAAMAHIRPPFPVQANIRPHDNTLISATGWRLARLEPNNGRGLIELQQLRESLYCHAVKCATCWDASCAQTHVRVHCTFHLNNKYSEQTFNLCETSLRFKGPNRICLVAMGIRGTCILGTW